VPTRTRGSRLATLSFVDPHEDGSWSFAAVPAGGHQELHSAPRRLSTEIAGAGSVRDVDAWVAETWSTSLLVLEGDHVVHEWYADGLGADTAFLGASMSKSVLAHLVGRAVRDGALRLADVVTDHVPELLGTGYEGATVLDVLTMTSGVDWVEDHRDPDGLASRLLGCFGERTASRELLREVGPGAESGTRFRYCTADSQVLDWVRERATGRGYVDEVARLWGDLGCTRGAVVAVDGAGVALAGGGLACTTRDWARVALLAVDGLAPSGARLLDGAWAEAAARPAYPFLAVGRLPSDITGHAGFGYHWWPMDDAGRRVTADGSRGQLACADRRTGVVVVKTSQWPYENPLVDRQARDLSYLGLHALLDLLETTSSATTKESL
jgi:CubicO group peptidase (beta-lactamase class C family)